MTTRVEIKIGSTLSSTVALMKALEHRFPDASLGKQTGGEKGIVFTIPDDTVGVWDDDYLHWDAAEALADLLLAQATGNEDTVSENPALAAHAAGVLLGLVQAKENPTGALFTDALQAVRFHLQ